jgi:soluble lytic murein transglycosylase-like protein
MGISLIVIGGILAALLLFPKKLAGIVENKVSPAVPSANSIDLLILENAKRYTLDPALIKAFIMVESSFNPNAVNPASATNKHTSYGLMQITAMLAEDYGIVHEWQNPTEAEIAMMKIPSTNIRIGSWFLSKLLNKHTLDESIQMYNVGEAGYLSGSRNSDYLSKIKRYYDAYKSN